MNPFLGLGLMGVVFLPWPTPAADQAATLLVGTKTCAMCHKRADTGGQFGAWQASSHSKAFESLGTAEAKAVGAKAGIAEPRKSGKCLKCHSTAYHFSEELKADAGRVLVEDGVSCESCHGPGKNYKSRTIMEDRKKSMEAGMIYPATTSCTLCHNDQSPSWKADRYTTKNGKLVGFDLEQAVEKIKHPNPRKK
jgi:hypothetical protein